MSDSPYKAVRCSCGHRSCKDWHVSPGADMQGVCFTKVQAELVAKVLNKHHRRELEQRMTNAVTLAFKDQ